MQVIRHRPVEAKALVLPHLVVVDSLLVRSLEKMSGYRIGRLIARQTLGHLMLPTRSSHGFLSLTTCKTYLLLRQLAMWHPSSFD